MDSLAEKTIKRNIRIYKPLRNLYDKIKFRDIGSSEKHFEKRLSKKRNLADKIFDLSNKPDKNIILITVDCLRADHVSYNSYFRKTTPFLDTINDKNILGVLRVYALCQIKK